MSRLDYEYGNPKLRRATSEYTCKSRTQKKEKKKRRKRSKYDVVFEIDVCVSALDEEEAIKKAQEAVDDLPEQIVFDVYKRIKRVEIS